MILVGLVTSITCEMGLRVARCLRRGAWRGCLVAVLATAAPVPVASAVTAPIETWYAGGGITYSSVEVCDLLGCLYADTVDPDIGINVTVGRRFTEGFALEFGYMDVGAPGWGDITSRYRVDIKGVHLAAAAIFPFLQRWQAFVKAGAIYTDARSRVSSFDFSTGRVERDSIDSQATELVLGGGIERLVAENWRVRVGLQFQGIDDRLLDAREGTLQGASVELHRVF